MQPAGSAAGPLLGFSYCFSHFILSLSLSSSITQLFIKTSQQPERKSDYLGFLLFAQLLFNFELLF